MRRLWRFWIVHAEVGVPVLSQSRGRTVEVSIASEPTAPTCGDVSSEVARWYAVTRFRRNFSAPRMRAVMMILRALARGGSEGAGGLTGGGAGGGAGLAGGGAGVGVVGFAGGAGAAGAAGGVPFPGATGTVP